MTEGSTRAVILVVEDDPRVRELLVEVLSDEGYDVLSATTGDEALSTITTVLPVLITLDLDLPGVSGAMVLQSLRAQDATRDVPVVLVSAQHAIAADVRGQAQAVVPKPFALDELLTIIKDLVPPPQRDTSAACD